MNDEILFSERQRFTQLWVWLILLGINGLFIYILIEQVMGGRPVGNKPMSDNGLIIATVASLLVSILLLCLRLETVIKKDGIYVRFFPFHLNPRYYSWENQHQPSVRKYHPIREFGGWGLRGLGNNRALNVSGNYGIQLTTKDGLKLLIGTNKVEEATEALKKIDRWSAS